MAYQKTGAVRKGERVRKTLQSRGRRQSLRSLLPMMGGVVEMLARLLFAWIAMQAGSYLLACACDPAAWLFAAVFLAASYKRVLRRMEVEWGCSP